MRRGSGSINLAGNVNMDYKKSGMEQGKRSREGENIPVIWNCSEESWMLQALQRRWECWDLGSLLLTADHLISLRLSWIVATQQKQSSDWTKSAHLAIKLEQIMETQYSDQMKTPTKTPHHSLLPYPTYHHQTCVERISAGSSKIAKLWHHISPPSKARRRTTHYVPPTDSDDVYRLRWKGRVNKKKTNCLRSCICNDSSFEHITQPIIANMTQSGIWNCFRLLYLSSRRISKLWKNVASPNGLIGHCSSV